VPNTDFNYEAALAKFQNGEIPEELCASEDQLEIALCDRRTVDYSVENL
jgi:hypothetical protein